MEQKAITNEAIRKKFINQFELVRHAITLAENMILTGRDARVKTDNQNRAMQVIAEIAAGKDFLDPILEKKQDSFDDHAASEQSNGKSERKRTRKILSN